MALEYAILGFLDERPRSGYDLKTRCFDDDARAFWTADQAQIYRTLDRLQKSRWVSVTRKRQSGKPDRKVYEITHAGREALAAWLATPLPMPATRDTFFTQLYFSAGLSDDELLGLLTARRQAHERMIEILQQQSVNLAANHTRSPRDEILKQTVLDGALAAQRAMVDWLDDCTRAVGDHALPGSDEGTGQRHLFGVTPA